MHVSQHNPKPTDGLEQTTEKQIFVTTSWDDGHRLDTKLGKLLRQYGVTGTFYVAPHSKELSSEDRLNDNSLRELSKEFEIGAHTLTHPHLTTLSDKEAQNEIMGSKEYLEKVLGTPVTSFCYPAGKYRPVHATQVREAGFTLARTVKRFTFTAGKNPYELPTSVHTYDHWLDIWNLAVFVRFNPLAFVRLYHKWDAQAIAMFDYVLENGGVFHLWGHSWEIEQHRDWDRLEQVLKHIAARPGVAYVPNNALV